MRVTAARPRRRSAAVSVVEVLTSSFVLTLLLGATLAVSNSVARSADRNQIDTRMVGDARLALDEVLYQLRSASLVLPSQTLVGNSYTTAADGKTFVLSAPGYDPASSTMLLADVTDYIAIQYDSTSKVLTETVVAGAGSKRPGRIRKLLVRNLGGFSCTFRARDRATATATGTQAFALKAPLASGATPAVFVDGVATASSLSSSGTYGSVLVPILTAGADVQIVYDVDPTRFATATASISTDSDKPALEAVVKMQFSETDSRGNPRTLSLDGAARLRNRRG